MLDVRQNRVGRGSGTEVVMQQYDAVIRKLHWSGHSGGVRGAVVGMEADTTRKIEEKHVLF